MKVKFDTLRKIKFCPNIGYRIKDGWEVLDEYFPVVFVPIEIEEAANQCWSAVVFRDKVTGKTKMLNFLVIPSYTAKDIAEGRAITYALTNEERDDILDQLLTERVDLNGYLNDLDKLMFRRYGE